MKTYHEVRPTPNGRDLHFDLVQAPMVLRCIVFVEICKQFQSQTLPPPAMFVYTGDSQGDK